MTTILVVDDDASVRQMTALVLERAGYRVVCASSGVEALMLYSSYGDRLDAVLSDVDMPGMDGIELAGRLRSGDPGVKILLMTGCIPPGTVAPRDFGILMKPFLPRQLISMVRGLLADEGERPL